MRNICMEVVWKHREAKEQIKFLVNLLRAIVFSPLLHCFQCYIEVW